MKFGVNNHFAIHDTSLFDTDRVPRFFHHPQESRTTVQVPVILKNSGESPSSPCYPLFTTLFSINIWHTSPYLIDTPSFLKISSNSANKSSVHCLLILIVTQTQSPQLGFGVNNQFGVNNHFAIHDTSLFDTDRVPRGIFSPPPRIPYYRTSPRHSEK